MIGLEIFNGRFILSCKERCHFQTFRIAITDALSGLAASSIKLDGIEASQPLMLEPYSLALGAHVIEVSAADIAGNAMTRQYSFTVIMDIDHLDEGIELGYDKGWIRNEGSLNSILGKIDILQKHEGDKSLTLNGLNALENEIKAQSGKQIDKTFADELLADIAYLKKQLY